MKKLFILILVLMSGIFLKAQTPLTEAIDFHVKTLEGDPIYLFPLLDDNKIVVIDFFSTTCGPCQDYAPDFQEAYEEFGENQSNVFFMGINWGDDNDGVREFDSVFGLTYPTVSGIQGGGNYVYLDYEILAYPTVIIITPDHEIVEQHIWPPTSENIINAVVEAGGLFVGVDSEKEVLENAVVYPNPASDQAVLKLNVVESASFDFDLIDILGNTIYSSEKHLLNSGSNNFRLPISDLANGLYFVKIKSNGVVLDMCRFIVAR